MLAPLIQFRFCLWSLNQVRMNVIKSWNKIIFEESWNLCLISITYSDYYAAELTVTPWTSTKTVCVHQHIPWSEIDSELTFCCDDDLMSSRCWFGYKTHKAAIYKTASAFQCKGQQRAALWAVVWQENCPVHEHKIRHDMLRILYDFCSTKII